MTTLIYTDVENEKSKIYKDNNNKCGIYKWTNKLNGKTYIGSSVNLARRLSTYLSLKTIKRIVGKESSMIFSALVKYGYNNFKLEIVEYCEKYKVIEKEQYYIEQFKPEYNILKVANSRFGFCLKFNIKKAISTSLRKNKKFRKMSQHVVCSKDSTCKNVSINTRAKLSLRSQGMNVKLFDSSGVFINKFPSFKSAANYLNVSTVTIKNTYDRGISYDNYIYEFESKDLRIFIYDKDHKLIDVLKDAKTTSIKYNIPRSTLSFYIKSNKLYKSKFYFYSK